MKILIISHNPISTFQNMGKTFLSLFSKFNKDELCQFYIYPTIPDIDACASYYRITDKDVLKSYYKFKVNGKEIFADNNSNKLFEEEKDESLYRNRKNKKPNRLLARDVMWKYSRWFNKELKRWLESQKPTGIFVAPGTGRFIYDIALEIAKKLDIPIVTYICDDYYFVKKEKRLIGKLQQKLLHKKIEKLLNRTERIITICNELAAVYSKHFGVATETVMTGSNYPVAKDAKETVAPQNITYMGNIRCNRYKCLAEIGKTLDEINEEYLTSYGLHIYTAEKDENILKTFDGIEAVKLCGFVTGEEFDRAFHSAEMFLHTEAFDEKSMDLVKHSVSTKIADCLGSGIPMFAYGPDCIASMKHLIRNDAAICATSRDELKEKLLIAFRDSNELKRVAQNGLTAARQYHNSSVAGNKIREMLLKVKKV